MSSRRLGRYEILREIASGGMAKVYLGRVVGEGGFERLVALKVMHEHIANDPEFVAMFLDEARLAARIRHPNVVSTLDVQKTPEGMFLVMDYVEGAALQDIRKLLRRERRRLPMEVSIRVVLDALAGLHAAHELADDDGAPLNLVHRDVSPHNVLVGTDGIARLTDFGVARAEARISNTASGRLKGKMAYMPPEQVMGEPIDRRSDLYAASIVLWEMLTGKRLFKAESEGELVHKILAGNPPWPHKVNGNVPLAISSACMRAMARKPDDRYETAEEFADALEAASRSAAVNPAKPRRVGTFLRELMPRLEQVPVATGGSTPASNVSGLMAPAAPEMAAGNESWLEDASGPRVASGMTNAGAVLSMAPPRSRRGLIAAAILGSLVLGAGGAALLIKQGESSTPAAGGGAAPNTASAEQPPPPVPEPAPTPSEEVATPTPQPQTSVARPLPRTQRKPRPSEPEPHPKTSPTNFRPSGL